MHSKWWILGPLVAASALFSACGGSRSAEPLLLPPEAVPSQTTRPLPPAVDLEPVYRRLEEAGLEFEQGIELILDGQEVAGEQHLALAFEQLRDDAELCSTIAECDAARFISEYDRWLTLQSIAIKHQSLEIGNLQASFEDVEDDLDREPGTSPFVAAMPEIGQAVSLLHGTDLRDIIHLNGPVNAALDDWLTWMRPMLMDSWVNYQFLRDQIAPVYEEAGLPEALLFAMIATETGGKVHAYSRAGAAGPLQFMRSTGRRYGLGVVDGFDMRLDPRAATEANVAYLNDQFAQLNNSLEKALAAYNGGESRVRSLHRRTGGASLWDSRIYWALPEETREYVPRILAAAWLFLHPEEYNLEFPSVAVETVAVEVREEIAIGELTICLGQFENPNGWFRTLRNLNPRLSPGERIEAGQTIIMPEVLVPVYEARCLDGDHVARARVLHDANYPDEPEMIVYTVRRGDTLGRIASRHRCASIRQIAALNGIRAPRYVIRAGQRIKVPACG